MRVISESWGFTLMFDSQEDMESTIENLQGELEWAKKNNLSYPKSYCVFGDEKKEPKEVSEYLHELNKKFRESGSEVV